MFATTFALALFLLLARAFDLDVPVTVPVAHLRPVGLGRHALMQAFRLDPKMTLLFLEPGEAVFQFPPALVDRLPFGLVAQGAPGLRLRDLLLDPLGLIPACADQNP